MSKVNDLCEICGKGERGYSVERTNVELGRLKDGNARRRVESFTCSRCVQRLLSEMNRRAREAREMARKGSIRVLAGA